MGSTSIVKNTHPHVDFDNIEQRGLKALNLVLTYGAQLGPRLPAGIAQEITDDLQALGVAVPGARQAHAEAHVANAAQSAALGTGFDKARAVRKAVRAAKAPREVQKAYGVGTIMSREVVRDVKAALNQIIDRATAQPDEAATFGLIGSDVGEMAALVAAIGTADETHAKKRAGAPQSTKARNATANRILLAIGRVEAAGLIQFAHDPAVLESFVMLAGAPKKAKKGEPKAPTKAPKAAPKGEGTATITG